MPQKQFATPLRQSRSCFHRFPCVTAIRGCLRQIVKYFPVSHMPSTALGEKGVEESETNLKDLPRFPRGPEKQTALVNPNPPQLRRCNGRHVLLSGLAPLQPSGSFVGSPCPVLGAEAWLRFVPLKRDRLFQSPMIGLQLLFVRQRDIFSPFAGFVR